MAGRGVEMTELDLDAIVLSPHGNGGNNPGHQHQHHQPALIAPPAAAAPLASSPDPDAGWEDTVTTEDLFHAASRHASKTELHSTASSATHLSASTACARSKSSSTTTSSSTHCQVSVFSALVALTALIIFLTALVSIVIPLRSTDASLGATEDEAFVALDDYFDTTLGGIRANVAGRLGLFSLQLGVTTTAQFRDVAANTEGMRTSSAANTFAEPFEAVVQPTRVASSTEWLARDPANTWVADTVGFTTQLHKTIIATAVERGTSLYSYFYDNGQAFAVDTVRYNPDGGTTASIFYAVQFADEVADNTTCELPEEVFDPDSFLGVFYPPPQRTCPQAKVNWQLYGCEVDLPPIGLRNTNASLLFNNPDLVPLRARAEEWTPRCSSPSRPVPDSFVTRNGHTVASGGFVTVFFDIQDPSLGVADLNGGTVIGAGVGFAVNDSFGIVFQQVSSAAWNDAYTDEARRLSNQTVIAAVSDSVTTTELLPDLVLLSSEPFAFDTANRTEKQAHRIANRTIIRVAAQHLLAQYGSYQAVPDIAYREALVSDPSVIGCPLTATTTMTDAENCILITVSRVSFVGSADIIVISATPFSALAADVLRGAVLANSRVRHIFTRARSDASIAAIVAVFVVVFFLIIILACVAMLSRRFARPIRRLQRDIRKVARLEVEDPYLFQQTRILELQDIQTVYQSMKQGIHSFSKFVPAPVVKQIISGDARASELYFAKRPVTVMFTDIRGFTSISEKLPPERLMVLLEEYLTSMLKCIEATNGTVGDFIGDGILVFWNSPEAVADHAAKACECALAMHAALKELNPGWRAAGFPDVMCRVGISSGTVLSGNIGSPHKMKFGVVGDTVNLASRVENLNKRYETVRLVTESTRGMLEGRFAFRPVDRVVVKGREASTTLYELLGEAEPAAGMVASSERLFELYLAQDFAGVEAAGREHLQRYGQDDGPVVALMARSRHLVAHPPEGAWDGTTVMASK